MFQERARDASGALHRADLLRRPVSEALQQHRDGDDGERTDASDGPPPRRAIGGRRLGAQRRPDARRDLGRNLGGGVGVHREACHGAAYPVQRREVVGDARIGAGAAPQSRRRAVVEQSGPKIRQYLHRHRALEVLAVLARRAAHPSSSPHL
jgi:hypothetical protein